MEHNVNPETDRCVRCGRNQFNRKNQPICMTTGDYLDKWISEEEDRKLQAQGTRFPEGAEL